jgi:hypothetical protein
MTNVLATEFPEFESILQRHAQVYAKKITDDLAQAYWVALKDISFATVRRCADNHLRFGKFFPKPSELRPRDELPTSVKEDHAFKAALDQNIRNWDERIRLDPVNGMELLRKAYEARAMVRDL